MLTLELSQVIIQIIGFLGMLWILKRFGWQPLLSILDERREKIRGEFQAAADKNREAAKLASEYEEKLKDIDTIKRRKIQEGVEDAQRIAAAIQDDATKKAKATLEGVKGQVAEELARAAHELQNDMVDIVVDVSKKMFDHDLHGPEQKKLIKEFVEEAKLK